MIPDSHKISSKVLLLFKIADNKDLLIISKMFPEKIAFSTCQPLSSGSRKYVERRAYHFKNLNINNAEILDVKLTIFFCLSNVLFSSYTGYLFTEKYYLYKMSFKTTLQIFSTQLHNHLRH